VGGRFLELDERSGIYEDIGDKKATEKTSQALREGQTKIRKKLYTNENEGAGAGEPPVAPVWSNNTPSSDESLPANVQPVISSEGYFGFSVQVLESLYKAEEIVSVARGEYGESIPSADVTAAVADTVAATVAATTENMWNGYVHAPPASSSEYGDSIVVAKAPERFPGRQPTHQEKQQGQEQQHQLIQTPLPDSSSAYVNSIAVARALEQFPGAAPPTQQAAPTQQEQQPMSPYQSRFAKRDADATETNMVLDQFPGTARGQSQAYLHAPVGRFTNMSSVRTSEVGNRGGGGVFRPSVEGGRLTNMTLASMFSINSSIRQILDSAHRGEIYRQADRGTIESMLSAEIRDLIRMSAPQLDLVGNLAMDDMDVHMDKEVDRFLKDTMEERVSDLRFTDVTRWSSYDTEFTNNSKNSLMDTSTSSSDNMSVHTSHGCNKRSKYSTQDSGDIASAELLLQLSADHGRRRHAI
jgi:hypothetical protein